MLLWKLAESLNLLLCSALFQEVDAFTRNTKAFETSVLLNPPTCVWNISIAESPNFAVLSFNSSLGWFQWLSDYILLSSMSYYFSLSHSPTIITSSSVTSAFSLPISIIILDLTISKFISWTTNLRKHTNFIRFQILKRYIKLENRNYIID
jgi:hypothetical protein